LFRLGRRRQEAQDQHRRWRTGRRGLNILTGPRKTKEEQSVAKGFIRGVLSGAGVSLCAVVVVSLLDSGPGGPASQVSQDRVQPRPGTIAQANDRIVQDNSAASGLEVGEVPVPQPDTLAQLLSDALNSAAVPLTGVASDLQSAEAPQSDPLGGIATPDAQAPSLPEAQTATLTTPSTEPVVSISTDPAQPRAPEPIPQAMAFEEPPADDTEGAQPKDIAVAATDADAAVEDIALAPQVTSEIAALEIPPSVSGLGSADLEAMPQSDTARPETAEAVDRVAPESAPALALEQDQMPEPDTQTAVPPAEAEKQELEVAQLEAGDADSPAPDVISDAPTQPAAMAVAADIVQRPLPTEQMAALEKTVDLLPVPSVAVQNTQTGDSSSVRVSAEQSVEAPAIAPEPVETPDLVAKAVMPAPEAVSLDGLNAAPREDAKPRADTAPAEIAAPVIAEVQRASETVRVNRLPSLATPETEAEDVPQPEEEVAQTPSATAADGRPFDAYAVAFENAENKPAIAVILMDDGVDRAATGTSMTALRALPYPVSFAVDALLPDAAERMRDYRAAGFEVLATVDLPEGARASDAEVNLAIALEAMPEVVAVLDGVGTGVQTTPDAGRQVAQILAQTGHGFVTQNRGLNTVQKLAAREGVPSAVVFRDLDAKGQDSRVIRRFLDQAAFRAGQEGSVVMLGRLREETVSALVLWALQDRASSVAMAPVTAVLGRP
jgi:polysaccharide deacetylase 2 family uncharacterized protein YibQ